MTREGKSFGGVHDSSHWSHRFDVDGATDLVPVLDVLGMLAVHGTLFRRIDEEGASVELFCGVFADGNWDEVVPYSLMHSLPVLRINLRLDVYGAKARRNSAVGLDST